MTRKLKKSETLEIRIPYPTKQAFMARCRDEGVSASEALRGFIDGHLDRPGRSRRTLRLTAGAIIAAAVAGAALPTLAMASHDSQAAFARIDRDGDGQISFAEYSAR